MTEDDGEPAARQWERVEVAEVAAGLAKEGGEEEEAALPPGPEAEAEAAVLPDLASNTLFRSL